MALDCKFGLPRVEKADVALGVVDADVDAILAFDDADEDVDTEGI